jgi:hypothetical protein
MLQGRLGGRAVLGQRQRLAVQQRLDATAEPWQTIDALGTIAYPVEPADADRMLRTTGKRKIAAALFAPTVVVLFAVGATSVHGESGLEAEVARLRARVAELEAENAQLRNDAGLVATLDSAANETVRVTFDEDTDTTTIATTPSRLVRAGGTPLRHWLTLQATYPGRTPPPSPTDALLVVETSASSGDYRGATALRLVIDGRAEECPVVRYATEPIVAGRMVVPAGERETVTVSLPAAALARMAAGRDVRAALGANEFALTAEQIAALRAFRKRLQT